MWYYVAAVGWLALCGLAFSVYKKVSWKDIAIKAPAVLLAALCASVVIGLVFGSAFLFVYILYTLFGNAGAAAAAVIWFWLIVFTLFSEDSIRHGVKMATAFVAVLVPLIILLFKAGFYG